MTDLKPKIATSSSKEKEKMKQKQKQQQSSSSKIKSAVAAVPSGRGRSSKQRKGAAGTRRRSFVNDSDRQTLEQKPPVDTNTATMPVDPIAATVPDSSSSSAADPVANDSDDKDSSRILDASEMLDKIDSWSSVVQQPSCLMCQMTFENEIKLGRHIKYSSLHASTLKQQKEKEIEIQVALEEKRNPKPPILQEEDIHYKQLYSGDKTFWRTRMNVEIRIFLHVSTQVLEVAGYNKNHNTPTNRLYLHYDTLLHVIEEMAIKAVQQRKDEIKERQKEAHKRRKEFTEVIPSEEIMLIEAKRVVIVTHILDRLQIDLHGGKDKPQLFYLPIVKISETERGKVDDDDDDDDDDSGESPTFNKTQYCESEILLNDPPIELQPVYISWRRYSSVEECAAARNDLESGMKDLAAASERANKLTELTFATTAGLGAIAERYKRMRDMGYSKWRIKWIWATKRIIIQKDVARYTKILKDLGYELSE